MARKARRPGRGVPDSFAFFPRICYHDPAMEERIGEALVRIGAMKSYQVEDVLRLQQGGDRRMFGEIAIELGYIDDEAIRKYLSSKKGA